MNYGQLKAHVASWLNRDDLTVIIPTWIQLAQLQIERANRFSYMLQTDDTLTATSGKLTLPAYHKEPAWLHVEANSKRYVLEQMEESALWAGFPNTSDTGVPEAFAMATQGTKLLLRPLPDAGYTYRYGYYAYSADLSADGDTNWLTTNAPDVLLYTALLMAAPYLDEDSRASTWAELLAVSLKAVKHLDSRMRYGGSPQYVKLEATVV
jgi:hypothetical protein